MSAVLDQIVKKALNRADVMLSVCSHRWFDIDAMASAMQLFSNKRHRFTWNPVKGDALIDRARSRVASFFLLERSEDVLFFLDDDVIFREQDAVRLIDDCMKTESVVAGMYVQKGTLEKTCVFFDEQQVTFGEGQKPVEVEAVSTGFMAIHRKVLEKMAHEKIVPFCHFSSLKFYPFFQPYPVQKNGEWIYLSEDWAFCDRARNLGFKIYLNPSLLLEHKGEYRYSLADKMRTNKPKLESIEITLR